MKTALAMEMTLNQSLLDFHKLSETRQDPAVCILQLIAARNKFEANN